MKFEPQFPGHLERCYFCHNLWGKCTCEYPQTCVDDPSALGFDWHEFFITAPNVDCSGIHFVNPVEYYGEAYINSAIRR